MNKTFKKMISLMIALALVLAMGLTTMAATVEVKDSDDYVADRTFKAYKVFDGDYEDGKLVNLTADVTVQNPLLTAGRSQHSRQKPQSMPHRR